MKCANCGAELDNNATFCHSCGSVMGSDKVVETAQTDAKRNVIIILLIVILAFILCFGVAIVTYMNVNSKTEETEISETEVIQTPEPTYAIVTASPATQAPIQQEQAENGGYAYSPEDVIFDCVPDNQVYTAISSPSYVTYTDSEFGFKIDRPTHFVKASASNPAVRCCYETEDGAAVLRVCAARNAGGLTPKQLQSRFESIYDGVVTYSPVGSTWFAISVDGADDHHYAYYKVEQSVIRGFEFHFDGAHNLDIYSKYIDYIYSSFKKI